MRISDEIARVSPEIRSSILRVAARVVHESLQRGSGGWVHEGGCHAICAAARELGATYVEEMAAYRTFKAVFNNPLDAYWFGFPLCTGLIQAINMRDHRVYALLLAAEFALTEGAT